MKPIDKTGKGYLYFTEFAAGSPAVAIAASHNIKEEDVVNALAGIFKQLHDGSSCGLSNKDKLVVLRKEISDGEYDDILPKTEYSVAEIDIADKTIRCLIAEERIHRNKIPQGLYVYEMREGDFGDPCSIEEHVIVNFYGTLITAEPLPLKNNVLTLVQYIDEDTETEGDSDWGYLDENPITDVGAFFKQQQN